MSSSWVAQRHARLGKHKSAAQVAPESTRTHGGDSMPTAAGVAEVFGIDACGQQEVLSLTVTWEYQQMPGRGACGARWFMIGLCELDLHTTERAKLDPKDSPEEETKSLKGTIHLWWAQFSKCCIEMGVTQGRAIKLWEIPKTWLLSTWNDFTVLHGLLDLRPEAWGRIVSYVQARMDKCSGLIATEQAQSLCSLEQYSSYPLPHISWKWVLWNPGAE